MEKATSASSLGVTREAAAWAVSLQYDQIPDRIIKLAKAQAAGMFASAHAGMQTRAARQIAESARRHAPPGKSPVIATGDLMHLNEALAVNAAAGMAQDYDDYLFMGHTGHSAVWVAWLVGAEVGASGREVLAAQIAANEVSGRLGAACILGPHNGQMWTHIHLAGAVVAAGKLFGLTAEQLTHALGIAYAQPVYGLYPGFFGPGSKLLVASTPIHIGLQAVRYAQTGLTGCPTIWEDPQGFLRQFSYRPLPNMLSGWGSAWLTDTLAIKPYPGCAYIDTTIDGILELQSRIAEEKGKFNVGDVADVDVAASMLTIEMNRLSHQHLDESNLTPININFNIPVNVAITLLSGRLGSGELTEEFLESRREAIVALSHIITLRHDWRATFDLLGDLDDTVGAPRFFGGITLKDLRYIRTRAARDGHVRLEIPPGERMEVLRLLISREGRSARKLFTGNLRKLWPGKRTASLKLDDIDFSKVRLPFQSRVTIRLVDGSVYTTVCTLPRGCAAKGDLEQVAKEKLERELRRVVPEDQTGRAWDAVHHVEALGPLAVLEAMSASLAHK